MVFRLINSYKREGCRRLLLELVQLPLHGKKPLQVATDAPLQEVVEVDHTQGHQQDVVLS